MRPRLILALTLFASLVVGLVPAFESANAALPPTCGPYVDLTPSSGQAGSVVSVNIFHYPANVDVQVVARITGDPVIGTGKTDAEGHANIIVTIPAFSGDYLNIFTYAPPCNASGAHFFYRAVTPTPVTPTRTPTQPTAVVTSTPPTSTPPTSTPLPATEAPKPPPAPPLAGTGGGFGTGSTGFDLALVALALLVFSSGFTLLGSSRKRSAVRQVVTTDESRPASPFDDEPPTPFN